MSNSWSICGATIISCSESFHSPLSSPVALSIKTGTSGSSISSEKMKSRHPSHDCFTATTSVRPTNVLEKGAPSSVVPVTVSGAGRTRGASNELTRSRVRPRHRDRDHTSGTSLIRPTWQSPRALQLSSRRPRCSDERNEQRLFPRRRSGSDCRRPYSDTG